MHAYDCDHFHTEFTLITYALYFQEHNKALAMEKKQKQVDKQITEWKSKFDGKQAELDQANRAAHAASTEVEYTIA